MKTITLKQVSNVCRFYKLGRWTNQFASLMREGKTSNEYFDEVLFRRRYPAFVACLDTLKAVNSAHHAVKGWWGPEAVERARRALAIAG